MNTNLPFLGSSAPHHAGSDLTPDRRAGLPHPCRRIGLAALLLLGLGAPARALVQWGDNPEVIGNYYDAPYVMVPMQRSVAIIQMHEVGLIQIARLDTSGHPAPPLSFLWDDPQYPGQIEGNLPVAGCPVGPNLFAIGYSLLDGTVRVALMRKWGNAYEPLSGFPKSIGTGFGLKMVPYLPNLPDPQNNGVLVAWLEPHDHGPHAPVYVQVQGLERNSDFVWPDHEDGVRVGETHENAVVNKSHSIISDGLGMAIITFPASISPSPSPVYKTAKLAPGLGAQHQWYPIPLVVPGQSGGTTPGDCFVSRDNAGGAFYAYAKNGTTLVVTHLNDEGFETYGPWLRPGASPLAAVSTPDGSVVVAYREATKFRAQKFDALLTEQWSPPASGATSDSPQEADGVLTPFGVAFAWTTEDDANVASVKSMLYDPETGAARWPGEVEVTFPTWGFSSTHRPQIIRSPGGKKLRRPGGPPLPAAAPGLIIGWNYLNFGVFVDRLESVDGSFSP